MHRSRPHLLPIAGEPLRCGASGASPRPHVYTRCSILYSSRHVNSSCDGNLYITHLYVVLGLMVARESLHALQAYRNRHPCHEPLLAALLQSHALALKLEVHAPTLTMPGLAGDSMQLDAPLRSKELASLPMRMAATLGNPVQGADPAQPALQLAWQDPGVQPHKGVQHPPGGSPHVLAAAAMVEATGDVVPAGDFSGARDQHAEGEAQGPGAGRRVRGPSFSQYRCASQQVKPNG